MGGGLSLGGSKSESSNNAGFNQDVLGAQTPALQQLWGAAGNLGSEAFGKGGNKAGSQMDFGREFSRNSMRDALNPWRDQMSGGAYGGQDWGARMGESIDTMQDRGPSQESQINEMIMGGAGNNYADAMKSNFMQDAQDLKDQNLRSLDARAAASMMSGGSGHGNAIGRSFSDIDKNTLANINTLGYDTFDKDLDRKLAIARNADTNLFNRDVQNQNMIGSMMRGQQGSMDLGINNTGNFMGYGNTQQMMPWQQLGQYASAVGAPTVLSSGSSAGSSKGMGLGGSMGAK